MAVKGKMEMVLSFSEATSQQPSSKTKSKVGNEPMIVYKDDDEDEDEDMAEEGESDDEESEDEEIKEIDLKRVKKGDGSSMED
jgi:hypothetical protein